MSTAVTDRTRSSSKRSTGRTERLEARITPELKALLKQAAAIEGRSVTDFVADSVRQAAIATIQQHNVLRFSGEDSRVIAEALLNPPPPNEELKAAFRRYREVFGE